ncbi:MAG: hypothetical protein NC548_29210 [Lachnospiraceae bacterium]|nr:hypothetical protein [Lachnospiraceae bacterium]
MIISRISRASKHGTDVNVITHDMISVFLKGTLDEKFDGDFGYSKYDYRNKHIVDIENSYIHTSNRVPLIRHSACNINRPADGTEGKYRRLSYRASAFICIKTANTDVYGLSGVIPLTPCAPRAGLEPTTTRLTAHLVEC